MTRLFIELAELNAADVLSKSKEMEDGTRAEMTEEELAAASEFLQDKRVLAAAIRFGDGQGGTANSAPYTEDQRQAAFEAVFAKIGSDLAEVLPPHIGGEESNLIVVP